MEKNNRNKLIAIIAAAAVIIIVVCLIAVNAGKNDNNSSLVRSSGGQKVEDSVNNDSEEQQAPDTANNEEPQEKVTPTFMYFISGNDQNFDETNAMIEELKAQYGEQVLFDIVNIDEHPEAIDNFPVAGQTPVLIMLNTSNDISAIEFMCNDKAKLEEDIQNALQ